MKRLLATIAAIGLLAAAEPAQAGVDHQWTGGSASWCAAGNWNSGGAGTYPGGPATNQRCDDHALINQAGAGGAYTVTFSACGSTNFNTLMVCNLLFDANVAGPQDITLNVVDDELYADQTTVTAVAERVTWDVNGGSFHPGDVTATFSTGTFVIDQDGGVISVLCMDIDGSSTGDVDFDFDTGRFKAQTIDIDLSNGGTVDLNVGTAAAATFFARDIDSTTTNGNNTITVDAGEFIVTGDLDLDATFGAPKIDHNGGLFRVQNVDMDTSGFSANLDVDIDGGEFYAAAVDMNAAGSGAVTFAVDDAEAHIGSLDMISGTGAVALNIGVTTAPEVRIGRFEMSANASFAATLNVDSGELLIGDLVVNGNATVDAQIDVEVDVEVAGHMVINGDTTIDVLDCKYFVADVITLEGPMTLTKNGTGIFHSS